MAMGVGWGCASNFRQDSFSEELTSKLPSVDEKVLAMTV